MYRAKIRGSVKSNIINQRSFLKAEAERHGMEYKEYSEVQNIINDLEEGDIIGAFDYSRISRDNQLILSLLKAADSKRVIIEIAGEEVANHPQSKLFPFAIANYEAERHRERIIAGIRAARMAKGLIKD